MSVLFPDLDKATKEMVDEMSEKIVPLVEPILEQAIGKLKDALVEVLKGRKINITVTIE